MAHWKIVCFQNIFANIFSLNISSIVQSTIFNVTLHGACLSHSRTSSQMQMTNYTKQMDTVNLQSSSWDDTKN